MNTHTPKVGYLAWDPGTSRFGIVMDDLADTVWLRPLGGGREWTVRSQDIRSATAAEELSARVAEANARSRAAR
ncbi:hypothetical protein ABZ832_28735 [Streptantibioticus parmotrematis]|uniref:hypothetical protein n=1 Tax=Streptantibioticus parmotrematis TaxID=2873249 RepID=UPI0033EDEEDA